jgi:hypothetical protein
MKGRVEITQNFEKDRIQLYTSIGKVPYMVLLSDGEGTKPNRPGLFLDFHSRERYVQDQNTPRITHDSMYSFTVHLTPGDVSFYRTAWIRGNIAEQSMTVAMDKERIAEAKWNTPVTWNELRNRYGKFHHTGPIVRKNSGSYEHTTGWIKEGRIESSDGNILQVNKSPNKLEMVYSGNNGTEYLIAFMGDTTSETQVVLQKGELPGVTIPLEDLVSRDNN